MGAIELPGVPENRIHAWHLFPIRLRLDRLSIDRNAFIAALRERGRRLLGALAAAALASLLQRALRLDARLFPVATPLWERSISLPLFPGMRGDEREYVAQVVHDLCRQHAA